MGCGSSQAPKIANPENTIEKCMASNGGVANESGDDVVFSEDVKDDGSTVIIPVKYPPGEAFEIPLVPEPDSSLIKKHPPKRLQKLLEDRPQTPQTIEDLEEKLEHAKLRRQQILSQRIENTIKLREKEKDNSVIDEEGDCVEGSEEGQEGGEKKLTNLLNDSNNNINNENENNNNLNDEILRKNQLNIN